MKNIFFIILFIISVQFSFSQLYTSAGSEIYVSADDFLYSNENIENNGTVTLKNNSSLIIDADLVNNSQITYQDGTDKAIFQIGSGESTSNQPQDIQFNANITEEAPFIRLNKLAETVTISRGHMRLLESFVSVSGTLDANSYINPADAIVDPGRVFGLTFSNPDMTNPAQVDVSSGGEIRNVLIERFIPAGDLNTRAYRLLTSSVNSTGTINANWQEGAVTTAVGNGNPNSGFGIHITGGSADDGFDQSGSGSPSMFTFDNTNANGTADQFDDWSALSDTDVKGLKTGEAYLTFVRGDRSINLTINNPTPTNTILRTIGDLQVGSFTFSSTNNTSPTPEFGLNDQAGFYSLVGNPYQAIVDFRNITLNNVSPFYYWVWDPNVGDRGNYVTLDFTNLDPNVILSNNSNSEANQYLQPGQSFFVQTIADATASITFNENDKDISADAVTVFSEQSDPSVSLLLYSTDAYNSGDRESDGLVVKFNENNSNAYDIMDADKFFGSDENLARLHGSDYISIENRAMPTDAEILPLSTTGYIEDNYTFVVDAANVQNNFEVFLKDNYTSTQTQLNEGATAINFSVDANIPESIASDRFSLVFDNTTLTVDDNTFGAGFSLFPNPTEDGHFSIKTPNLNGEVEVKLNNMLGQIVLNETLTIVGNEVNVKANGLSTGVYIVELSQDEQTFTTKLIVE